MSREPDRADLNLQLNPVEDKRKVLTLTYKVSLNIHLGTCLHIRAPEALVTITLEVEIREAYLCSYLC